MNGIDIKTVCFMYFFSIRKVYRVILVGEKMGIVRAVICLFCPPLAVIDKGCGSFIIVLVLTCIGWLPGVIAALVICNQNQIE